MFKNAFILFFTAIVFINVGCGSSAPSHPVSNTASNSASMANREIKLDPANMPPGLSANAMQQPANMPPGISANAVNIPVGKTKVPGIPTEEELRKPFKPGKTPTPGIPSPDVIRKQMGLPPINPKAPPANSVPMMKSKKPVGEKPQ